MEQNQNTNEQLQPQKKPAVEVKENSKGITSETPAPSSEIKPQTPKSIEPESQTPIAIGTKPQTEPMEVHKHPHHVMHKKKWNEYTLEFFMIFFAVFLGFIAETIVSMLPKIAGRRSSPHR